MPTGTDRHFGVTVMPEYIQSEGIEGVLDRVVGEMGANVITTSPYLAEPTSAALGGREPPLDGGAGALRVLDRPLWGETALFLRTEPSFVPDTALYRDSPYDPPPTGALTARDGHVLDAFIAAARQRGAKVILQVMAAIPPCYKVQFGGPVEADKPMLPDGSTVPGRVDNNASLAANGVRAYVAAMIKDLLTRYPDIDGLKFDWPEYPPYHFWSLLADYNPQVAPIAAAAGIDFEALRGDMLGLQRLVASGNLAASGLGLFSDFEGATAHLVERFPFIRTHLDLRRILVQDYARFLRASLDAADGAEKTLNLQGFPPPWNTLSGFDPARLETTSDRLAIKFYTMHWPMMIANYADHFRRAASGATDADLSAMAGLFLGPNWAARPLADIRYPEPHEPHGVGAQTITEKYRRAAIGLTRPLIAIAHSYGPIEDVAARFGAAWDASKGNTEINRYGYLSDEKITRIAAMAR